MLFAFTCMFAAILWSPLALADAALLWLVHVLPPEQSLLLLALTSLWWWWCLLCANAWLVTRVLATKAAAAMTATIANAVTVLFIIKISKLSTSILSLRKQMLKFLVREITYKNLNEISWVLIYYVILLVRFLLIAKTPDSGISLEKLQIRLWYSAEVLILFTHLKKI